MDTLPVEMRCEIGKYLTSGDLRRMRFLDSNWNDLAKYKLKSRQLPFTFNEIRRLAQFNDIFTNYQPITDLANFSFTFPMLGSEEGSAHLVTFCDTFGQSVRSLTLGICRDRLRQGGLSPYLLISKERAAMTRNLTLLLSQVKGQLQKLEVKDYFGLSPSVLGSEPFPALSTLTVVNIDDRFLDWEDRGRAAAIQKDCILELSRRVPAIKEFSFGYYDLEPRDDPAYLPTVLGNLVQANPEVRCKLNMRLHFVASGRSLQFVQQLTQVEVRIRDLRLVVPPEGVNREDFRLLLEYIGGQSSCLRKLTLYGSRAGRVRASAPVWLRLPSLCVLEELDLSRVSLLADNGGYANYLESLHRLTINYSGVDLAMTFPTVRDLTLENCSSALEAESAEEDFKRFITHFPNLWSLTCGIQFLTLPAFFKQRNLTRLNIGAQIQSDRFWEIVTQGSPRLTFDEIVDLDVGSVIEDEGTWDLGNLRELVFTIGVRVELKLKTVLYVSKIGKMKRLKKMVFQSIGPEPNQTEVARKCLRELQKYHCSVVIITN